MGQISDLIDRLDMEWPSLLRESNYGLWKEEWESHGSCSQAILPQRAFFETALKLKDKYKLMDMLANKGLTSQLKQSSFKYMNSTTFLLTLS